MVALRRRVPLAGELLTVRDIRVSKAASGQFQNNELIPFSRSPALRQTRIWANLLAMTNGGTVGKRVRAGLMVAGAFLVTGSTGCGNGGPACDPENPGDHMSVRSGNQFATVANGPERNEVKVTIETSRSGFEPDSAQVQAGSVAAVKSREYDRTDRRLVITLAHAITPAESISTGAGGKSVVDLSYKRANGEDLGLTIGVNLKPDGSLSVASLDMPGLGANCETEGLAAPALG